MRKLDISNPIFKKLELTEQNIKELFVSCLKKDTTPGAINATFFHESSSRTAPIVKFDKSLMEKTYLIRYLFGQLQTIHKNKRYLTPGAGSFNYTGNKWTTDNNVLSALYYLGTASGAIRKFVDGEKYAQSDLINLLTPLTPTYPPSDPNFKLEDAKKALEQLGVKLPEDITHLD